MNIGGIFGRRDKVGQFRALVAGKTAELIIHKTVGNFPCAVRAEIHENHAVAVFNLHRVSNAGGFDKFVVLATLIGGL